MYAFRGLLTGVLFLLTGVAVAGLPAVSGAPPLPDLVVEDLRLDRDCHVVVTVRNLGPGTIPSSVWTSHYPESSSVNLLINGKKWGGATIWKFDPARSLQGAGGKAIYVSTLKVTGSAVITALIDHTKQIEEANEVNNSRSEKLTCGADEDGNDLRVRLLEYPRTVRPGQDLDGRLVISAENIFTKPIKNVAIDIVLTRNPTYPIPAPYANYSPHFSDGVLLKGGREHVSFPPTAAVKVKLNGSNTIPRDTPPGFYYLGVVVDAGNNVVESDEKNNVAFGRIMVK